MKEIKEQFKFEIDSDFFDTDTHFEVNNLEIDQFYILAGETAEDDIILIQYEASPILSFYDSTGKLIDIDHYLPDDYQTHDIASVQTVIRNLKNINTEVIKGKKNLGAFLTDVLEKGKGNLAKGLNSSYGIVSSTLMLEKFKSAIKFEGSETEFKGFLLSYFDSFYNLLEKYVLTIQKYQNKYVHITPKGNIIITPVNKRCGLSIIIETRDIEGILLRPHKWAISRTKNVQSLDETLVFRTEDVKSFFKATSFEIFHESDRYILYQDNGKISIDSTLDNTDNLLKISTINNCYQIVSSDNNIIVILSNHKEVTILNTHRSVIPSKWPKKLILKNEATWIRSDLDITTLFVQEKSGELVVYDISTNSPEIITSLGTYAQGFEVDQSGGIICKVQNENKLLRIKTNVNDLETSSDQKTFSTIFKNLTHLFKGESLFTQTKFPKVITKEDAAIEIKLPTSTDKARYDFESNVEQMIMEAEGDYNKLLTVQNKIAIARLNISEELVGQAERQGVFLAGQRLKSTMNSIVRPSERNLRDIIEKTKAQIILDKTLMFGQDVHQLEDPDAYREILNSVRQYDEELMAMKKSNSEKVLTKFKEIQSLLNEAFSEQITSEGSTLEKFISGEITQIEDAISKTHDLRQLETLLSTHPASTELFNLLKQPYVLQNVAKEQKLSPAGIQARLHESIQKRKSQLLQEEERKEADKNAAKVQLARMIESSIDFFVQNHSSNFSDLELSANANYQQLLSDINRLERTHSDVRLAMELRRKLERRILERTSVDLEKMVAFEGKYAFIQNDPDLYVDWDSTPDNFPTWALEILEKKAESNTYQIFFIRSSDKTAYYPSTKDNLMSGLAFEIQESEYQDFLSSFNLYTDAKNSFKLLSAVWSVYIQESKVSEYPQFSVAQIKALLPLKEIDKKALRCAFEKKTREHLEKNRKRNVPKIPPEFIDNTPHFQSKLKEFIIKAKLQMVSGSGIILLSGPPSTGKSAFLKFASALMNREYFEHASDKWQTKNSLVTAVKFGENGPFAVPAGFTKAITTPYSLINIEEIKEWPEALRKSLNPFFAGSKVFIAPDGTNYQIGNNILMCAAANLGSMYRQDDEPFTADFWSRIEVVEYNYSPQYITQDCLKQLHKPEKNTLLNIKGLVRDYFGFYKAPKDVVKRAKYFSQQFIEFSLLPKADEKIKRDNLKNYILEYFDDESEEKDVLFSPEEAVKVAFKRLPDYHNYTVKEFFDLYDHFVNDSDLRSSRLAVLRTSDIERYEHFRIQFLCLKYTEGCLRKLRAVFYNSAGQTEIEGTNREFIKCVYLLGLLGTMK